MSNSANFIGRTGLFLALTRAFQLLAVPLSLRWPVTTSWMRDEFHHYQLGLLLIVPLLLCYRCGAALVGLVAAIGIGLAAGGAPHPD